MKFKKDRCNVLHLGQGKQQYHQILGGEWIGNSPVKRDLAILAGKNLDITWQCTLASQETKLTLGFIKRSRQVERGDSGPLVCSCKTTPGQLHPALRSRNMDLSEGGQKIIWGLEHFCHEWLRKLGLFSMEKRRHLGHLVILNGPYKKEGGLCFIYRESDR